MSVIIIIKSIADIIQDIIHFLFLIPPICMQLFWLWGEFEVRIFSSLDFYSVEEVKKPDAQSFIQHLFYLLCIAGSEHYEVLRSGES